MPLLTLADYQTAVGSTVNPAAQQIAVDNAIAAVLSYTDRDFDSAAVTESRDYTYRGNGYLEIDDCTAVHSVTSSFPIVFWAAHGDGPAAFKVLSWLELPKFDKRALESVGQMGFTSNLDVILQRAGWIAEWTVTVNADFGYLSVPNDVRQATIWLARYYQDSAAEGSGSGEIQAESVAETARTYVVNAPPQPASVEDSGIPPRVQALLWPYKRHVL